MTAAQYRSMVMRINRAKQLAAQYHRQRNFEMRNVQCDLHDRLVLDMIRMRNAHHA